MTPLNRTFPLAQVDHSARFIGEELDLDMPGPHQVFLHINRPVPERRFRLSERRLEGTR